MLERHRCDLFFVCVPGTSVCRSDLTSLIVRSARCVNVRLVSIGSSCIICMQGGQEDGSAAAYSTLLGLLRSPGPGAGQRHDRKRSKKETRAAAKDDSTQRTSGDFASS